MIMTKTILTEDQKLQMQLDATYAHCQQQSYSQWETIVYMQSHCKTDTETITDYLIQKQHDTERI